MTKKIKFTFRTAPEGWYGRNVTVRASDIHEAKDRALDELERRDERAGREGPTAYGLYLLKTVKEA